MTPKTLEEFIQKQCTEEYNNQGAGFHPGDYWDGAKATAAEILRVAEEWCGMDAYEHGYDKPTDEHTCDNSRGRQCSADELYDFLKSYIQPVKKESEDA